MGYDLHITRRTDWCDDEQAAIDITLEEWFAYIKQDDELELSTDYLVRVPGSETESQVSPGYCKWIKHPLGDDLGFDYREGCINMKNPDDATVKKMLFIATILKAYVQGDDREMYSLSTNGDITSSYLEDEPFIKKPWWKFW